MRTGGERVAGVFQSFFMGGFECSTHRLASGRRLDLIASTRHDRWALEDYRRLRTLGMQTARDGLRWTLIERTPDRYDFASARPMVDAAREAGVEIIWDLMHFGWPDHVDPFASEFPRRFAAYADAAARMLTEAGVERPLFVPINEMSFLAFAAGEAGFFNPFVHRRGDELKRALVRASIAGMRTIRDLAPGARFVHVDPIIHVVPRPDRPGDAGAARAHEQAQYHAWDMLTGRSDPDLGGSPDLVDVIGINYYVHNQWFYPGGHGSVVEPSSPDYRPLAEMLVDVHRRYGKPMFIAETGIEDDVRPTWLGIVAREVRAAMRRGVAMEGICLYPIVNHPGWEDDRHCHNGLWDYADASGHRPIFEPLAEEIRHQRERFERAAAGELPEEVPGPREMAALDVIAHSIAQATDRSREGD
jgi:beta-glucosidase/6-phospho-beta-glucosidase/beta-galactosidase